jgi:hypothetical protein
LRGEEEMACPDYTQWMVPAQQYTLNNLMRFDEPQQNLFKDCWFVAALSSHLFANPKTVNQGDYSFPFFDRGKTLYTIDVGNEVCCDTTGTICGADSINDTAYWPAVYEKAYAAFKQDKKNPPLQPEMQAICNVEGDAMDCLVEIHGGRKAEWLVSKKTITAIITDVQDHSVNTSGTSWATNLPYVADTANQNDPNILSNHAYSILGLIAPNYIILRNPKGTHPNINAGLQWTYFDFSAGQKKTLILPAMGIFAYEISDFKANFNAYGYVG